MICKKYAEVADYSNGSNTEVCRVSIGIDCSIALPDAKYLSVVDKSAFADILGEVAWSHT